MIGALTSFAILFIYGVCRLLHPLGKKVIVAAIILTMGVAVISQAVLDNQIFSSEHNWFNR